MCVISGYVDNRNFTQKYARIFVRGHNLFRGVKSLIFRESSELWGTDNVQGRISEHMFAPNGGYYVNYHFVFKTHSFLKFREYLVNKPLPAAGISADNVRGWEIVRKMNIWPRSEASRANVKFWGQSLSQGHYQPIYQQAGKGFIYFITLPLIIFRN